MKIKYFLLMCLAIAIALFCIDLFYDAEVPLSNEDGLDFDMPMCNIPIDSTAELSPEVQHILGLYLSSSSASDDSDVLDLVVERVDSIYCKLTVYSSNKHFYREGQFWGTARYRGHIVRLFGEAISAFWSSSIEEPIKNDPEPLLCGNFDFCTWYLYINMSLGTILSDSCWFFCDFPYPEDTLLSLWHP